MEKPADETIWDRPSEISSLTRDRNVMRALATYLQCTQKELTDALVLRASDNQSLKTCEGDSKETSRTFNRGYHTFRIPKSDGKTEREINDPAPVLKDIQRKLLYRLRQVPFSIAVTGGELGMSVKQNVEPHVRNRFMLTMDLKDAFPSTNGERVDANLKGHLDRQLKFSFPQLTEAEQERFKQAIITLIVKNDQLPQGAPTSTHILNLALAKTDSGIIKYLHTGEPSLHLPKYTRYIDDITISFRAFEAFLEPYKLVKDTGKKIYETLDGVRNEHSFEGEKVAALLKQIKQDVEKVISTPIKIHDEAERREFRKKVAEIRGNLTKLKSQAVVLSNTDAFKALDRLIGQLDQSIELEFLDGMNMVRDNVGKIIRQNGWQEKTSKTRVWTPKSTVAREVTGITIGQDGRLGIPGNNMDEYIALARQCAEVPETLPGRYKNRETGQPDPEAIAATLQGIRAFIVDVKGEPPKSFEIPYQKARNRFFDGWRMSRAVYPIRGGEGY